MSILLKSGKILLGEKIIESDVLIQEEKIVKVEKNISLQKDNSTKIINCSNKLIMPSFANTHAHGGMSLFRGYGDGLALQEWLSTKIWPVEAKLTEEDVYWNTRFACIEMIKNGVTCFCDMYWHFDGMIRAVIDSNIRGFAAESAIDLFDEKKSKEKIATIEKNYSNYLKKYKNNSLARFSLGPHAIYTVSENTLLFIKEFAKKNNIVLQIHLSETEQEVIDCVKKNGVRPVEYLEKIGFLDKKVKTILAHGVHVNSNEIKILKKYNVAIAHNPISNMKLAVGGVFPFVEYKKNGVCLTFGTDSVSSNNSLDMFESMKFASLLAKHNYNDALVFPALDALLMSSKNAFDFLGIDAGEIKEGKLADLLIIDLAHYSMVPSNDIISNLVYSAKSEAIESVICNGKIIMENRVVKDEELVRKKVEEITEKLIE